VCQTSRWSELPSAFEGYSFRFVASPVLTRLHARLAHAPIADPPAAQKGGSRGFLPSSSRLWCFANRNALLEGYASVSGAWSKEKPRTQRARGLHAGPATLAFRNGYPSASERCESRRNSPPGRARQGLRGSDALAAPEGAVFVNRFFIAGSVGFLDPAWMDNRMEGSMRWGCNLSRAGRG